MNDIGADASKRQYQGHPDARKRRLLALSKLTLNIKLSSESFHT